MIGHDFPYLDTRDLNLDWLLKTMKALVEKWENFTPEIQGFVNQWLDDHPEATTTVQDGSLTAPKFTDALKLQTLKDYVTPQMYGAKADGLTDDTAAIQAVFDTKKPVFFPKGTYLMNNQTVLMGHYNVEINLENADIIYPGAGYAFKITQCHDCVFRFGYVHAENGGCVEFFASSVLNAVQYINFYFLKFWAATNCIYADNTDSGWINEIRFYNGEFAAGNNGVYLLNESDDNTMNQWFFDNVGVEGVTNGFYFNAESHKPISEIFINGCRYSESFTTLYTTKGTVVNVTHISPQILRDTFFSLSAGTNRWLLFSPTIAHGKTGLTGTVVFGELVLDTERTFQLMGGNPVASGDDLNDFNTPGTYYCDSIAIASSLTNCPVATAFTMIVYYGNGSHYPAQEIRPYNSDRVYKRHATDISGSTWAGWTTAEAYFERNNLSYINITDAAGTGYTFTEDGYVSLLVTSAGSYIIGTLKGNTSTPEIPIVCEYTGSNNSTNTIFVKKGMKFTITDSSGNKGAFFYALVP